MGAVSEFSALTPMTVADNGWGGVLVGNFCAGNYYALHEQQVILTAISFVRNAYHPAFEYHSCQMSNQPLTIIRMSACRCEGGERRACETSQLQAPDIVCAWRRQ
jgi:hypothetical protein